MLCCASGKRRFTQRDGSRAVLYIYRCAKALSRFNEPIPRDIVTLAEKARFSQHGIGREERMAAYALFIGMRDQAVRQREFAQEICY